MRIDGEDQSESGGRFMWLRKANAACSMWRTCDEEDVFEGWHDGYLRLADPVMHRRRIHLLKTQRRIVVEDTLQMKGRHAVELFFHFSERCEVEPAAGGFTARHGDRAVALQLPQLAGGTSTLLAGSLDPLAGWISRRFDVRVPAPTLRWSAELAGDCVLRSVIEY